MYSVHGYTSTLQCYIYMYTLHYCVPYLWVYIQDTHLAGVDQLQHRVDLDAIVVVLEPAELYEFVFMVLFSHVSLGHKMEAELIFVYFGTTRSVWRRGREREKEREMVVCGMD